MTNNIDIVKQLFDACISKDFEKIRALVHPDYKVKDPMMSVNGVDEMIEMVKNCPFDNKIENLSIIGDGDKVVSTFDCVGTQPVASRLRMCSIATIENGKVRSEEMFYDTAQLPQAAKDMAKNVTGGGKKAA